MAVRFEWYTPDKTVMRYIAEGQWNWLDYHRAVRISTFSMMRHPHPVHSVVDLRGSTRTSLPSGFAAHARTFGKKQAAAFSGQAIVIGVAISDMPENTLDYDGTLHTDDGQVFFVQTEDAMRALLQAWGVAL